MLELNDTTLEVISGGHGSSWSFSSKTIKANTSKIKIDGNKIFNGAIMVQVTQVNGDLN